jgi:hypothetical protein
MIRREQDRALYTFNEISIWTKIFLLFIGYPRSTNNLKTDIDIKPWHFDFLETYEASSGWKFDFHIRLDSPEADLARKRETTDQLINDQKSKVWVQPTIPFIVLISVGFILEILIGNVVLVLMSIIIKG